MAVGLICTIAFFNVLGVSITKYASAAQRSTVDTCRTMLVWGVQLATHKEKFHALQLMGFVVLVIGTVVYNEIVIIPCEALNKNTRVNIDKRAREEKGGLLDGEGAEEGATTANNEYYGSSPTAAYDYSKNKRRLANRMSDRDNLIKDHQQKAMGGDDPIFINDYSERQGSTT